MEFLCLLLHTAKLILILCSYALMFNFLFVHYNCAQSSNLLHVIKMLMFFQVKLLFFRVQFGSNLMFSDEIAG